MLVSPAHLLNRQQANSGLSPDAPFFDGTDRLSKLQGGDFGVGLLSSFSGAVWLKPSAQTSLRSYICSAIYDIDLTPGTIDCYLEINNRLEPRVVMTSNFTQTTKQLDGLVALVENEWNLLLWCCDVDESFDHLAVVNSTTGGALEDQFDITFNTQAGPWADVLLNRGAYGIADFGASSTSQKYTGAMYNLWYNVNTAFEDINSAALGFSTTDWRPKALGPLGTFPGFGQPKMSLNQTVSQFFVNGGAAGTPCTLFGSLTAVPRPTQAGLP